MLKLYNTLTRKKEEFKPIEKGKVGLYTCGPTVYWFAHVGNMRSFVFADVLKRVLMYNGFKVRHIINVTDVGHLTSDADRGEDKLEKAAESEGKSAKEVSKFYFDAFKKDFFKLNLIEPNIWPKATEHIREQIDLIKILEKKGCIYRTSDGIYFDTSKFKDYGKLSNKKAEGLEAGKRIDFKEKKNKTDFALWKFSKPEDKRQQEWGSPWGVGFPGWHIECSAMSSKHLGKHFDIHTGGEDLASVHHENEIAQSECAFGESPWVNYWMHGAFLNFKGGKKMSKSTGKIKTISQLKEDGISPMAYRYFTFSAKYRKPLVWSEEAIEGAANSYKKLKEIISKVGDEKVSSDYLITFKERINDDLDMPGAISILWSLVRNKLLENSEELGKKYESKTTTKKDVIKKMDQVFGLGLLEVEEKVEVPKDILKLAKDRSKARDEKNWDKSDKLRDLIKDKGWIVKDSKEGFELEIE